MVILDQLKRSVSSVVTIFFILSFGLTLSACDQSEKSTPTINKSQGTSLPLLEKIKQRGKLVVLTINIPTTYYYDRDNNLAGPEYDMTQSFAASLQVDVEYKVLPIYKIITGCTTSS